ncbi:hypothetical protein PIB30_098883 [Stylosanthes scabra]|uniref:Uncharacterized protein n=1 Tax=Stylosanthes scabra TaxID=79078 RepID=A0ABU6VXK9_9FABA|nr:hypothetical protein [Stylosanthes scabra]
MAGNDVTLSRLRNLLRPPQNGSVPQARVAPVASGPSSLGRVSTPPVIPILENRATPKKGSSNETGRGQDHLVDVSSPLQEEQLRRPSPNKRPAEEGFVGSKRPRVSEGGRGSLARWIIPSTPREALRDYDPVESVRWAEWAMLRTAMILKSVEPRLTVADEVERRNAKLLGNLKVLDLQKLVVEEEKADAVAVKLKAEEELKSAETKLETLAKEKDRETERLKLREAGLVSKAEKFRGLVTEEKVRADLAEVSVSELQKQCEELAENVKMAVSTIEGAVKAQLAILVPDFDTSEISFFKDIVDGKVVGPSY